MNIKYNKFLILCILLTCTMIFTGCNKDDKKKNSASGDAKKAEKIKFVLDWTPNTNHTGIYVADKLGYFAAEGIDIEIVQPPENGAEAMVASNQAQFGVSFQDYLAPAMSGSCAMPLKAVAAILQHNTSGIVSRKGEGMDKPKGLEGKKYATWDLAIEKAIIKDVVENDKGDFSKIKMIPSTVTDEVSALKSKSVDAIWIFYGWAGIAIETAKMDVDYFEFRDINPVFDYYTPVIISNDTFLKENPDTAKAFLKAAKKGYEYAIANPKEAADILCEAAPEIDKDMALNSQKWMTKQYKAEVKQWGYMDAKRWNAFFNWLNDNKLVEENIPENSGFTNDYLPE